MSRLMQFLVLPAVAMSCKHGRNTKEYSFKLDQNLFADPPRALHMLSVELDRIQQSNNWFMHSNNHERKHQITQVIGFLDDAAGSFKRRGLQLRFRQRESGTNNWSRFNDTVWVTNNWLTEMAVKYVSGVRHDAMSFPDQAAKEWFRTWHCKVEGNVYSSGQTLWQATGSAVGVDEHSKLVQEFPSYRNFTSVADIDEIFPGILEFVYGHEASFLPHMPLIVTRQHYAWLQDIELWLGNVPIVGVITLVYDSHSAREDAHTAPINADFEWKVNAADASWDQQQHSEKLLHLLTGSALGNRSYTPPYAKALKSSQGAHGTAHSAFLVKVGVFLVVASLVFWLSPPSLRNTRQSAIVDVEKPFVRLEDESALLNGMGKAASVLQSW